MEIEPIAYFRSPLSGKFGLPRQAGLASELEGYVEFCPHFRREEALRGLEGFDYLWLIWGFHLNAGSPSQLTVRPPRLGGNKKIGVFASRSPFRPNGLGLSSVRIVEVEAERALLRVSGADLADGTPIYDIKPYVAYADAHPEARSGFVDSSTWESLESVETSLCPSEEKLWDCFSEKDRAAIKELILQDPRPAYHSDSTREYHIVYKDKDLSFRIQGSKATIISIKAI